MKTLTNLKTRLEALPDIREGRQHEAFYAEFLKKSIDAAEKLAKAEKGAVHATPILPATAYNQASRTVRLAIGIASRLRKKLTDEPGEVVDQNIDASFIRLFENATLSLKTCQNAWETQLQGRIKDWQVIGEVVAKLAEKQDAKSMKPQTEKLRIAIKSLETAKTKLPQTKQEASEVQSDLKDLNDSVSKLGLDSPFGKFLQDAASPFGAGLDVAQGTEVSKQIAELKLAKVFRVRLSS